MKKTLLLLNILIVLIFTLGCQDTVDKTLTLNDKTPTENTPNVETPTQNIPSVDEPTEQTPPETEIPLDYGELVIPRLTIYNGFPDKPNPTFTKEEYTSEITYTVLYSAVVTYLDGYFYASGEGEAMVEAKTMYHSTIFIVEAKNYLSVRGEAQTKNFLNRIEKVEEKWQSERITGGTLFIGDSFFDEYQFFTNFYDLYKGENAYCHGISSSRIEDWYVFSKRLVYPVEPSNIVLHLGTNDMFSGKENPVDMLEEMKVLFNEYFNRLPNVNIYWFAIEPRTYGINGGAFDTYSADTIKLMNSLMKEYCASNDRLHYVDVSGYCFKEGGIVDANFFKDGVHPKIEKYILYCEALKEAGLDLGINKPASTTEVIEFDENSTVSSSATTILKNDVVLNNNFSISGKVLITKTGNNPHLEFDFDGTHFNNRFLIWDNDNNGIFKLGYAIDKTHKSNVNDVDIKINEEFTFEIIITSKHAYLYINNNLELVFRNVSAKMFTISSANTKAIFTDLVIVSSQDSKDWNTIINRSEISVLENDTSTKKEILVM